MGFGEKLKKAFNKIKSKVIGGALALAIAIWWLVGPLALATAYAKSNAKMNFDWDAFFYELFDGLQAPWSVYGTIIEFEKARYYFGNIVLFFLGMMGVAMIIGISRAWPKHEYDSIENGSSDWCQGGEQYKVLSKKTGIVLAEDNYLPTNKRGNVNVLVVRRFWCW